VLPVMIVSALIAGFRYAVTVPAELPSNWAIRMVWLGDERSYLAGVKRAALVTLVALPPLVLFPLHVRLFGFVGAVTHSVNGLLLATATLDALFVGYRKVPFACSYVPIQNPKVVWPAGAAGFLSLNYGFAQAERAALQTPLHAVAVCASLLAIVVLARLIDQARRRDRLPVNFDEGPVPATLRLGLFDRMAVRD
jgi:hypothetical protein